VFLVTVADDFVAC